LVLKGHGLSHAETTTHLDGFGREVLQTMKPSLATALLIATCALAVFAQGDATDIVALERKWAEAQKAGNAAPVAEILASSFVSTDVDGHTFTRDQLLSNLKGGHWELNEISDIKVTLYGNTAIATGAWVGKGTDGDGTKIDRRERWTDTWIKMPSGKWQCVASHQSTVK
jgi:ketosteroid isomerase-like protein